MSSWRKGKKDIKEGVSPLCLSNGREEEEELDHSSLALEQLLFKASFRL